MNHNQEIAEKLRDMAVNTGTLNCLGCGFEHNCSVHGCAVLKQAAELISQPNEPLTLEQLREMDETPIYVVTEAYGSGWCILNWHGVNKSYTYFSRTGTSEGMTATPLSVKTYGDLWTAYRRPPERQEDT